MRSRLLRWIVPVFAVMAALAASGAAQAGTYTYTRSITISVTHVSDGDYVISGTVTVTNPDSEYTAGECVVGKTVTLFVNGSPVGTGIVAADGSYSIPVHLEGDATLNTAVGADVGNTTHPFNHTCEPATSEKKSVVLGGTVTSPPPTTPPPTSPPPTSPPARSPPTKSGVGGTAFTGSSGVIPLAGGALLLVLVGSGLLWVGRRGRAGS